MTTLGVALIGCGAISGVHLKAIAGMDSARLIAVADSDTERAQRTGAQYGCGYYTDYRELLQRSDVDVVHICTGHYLHAMMAVDALAAGKHVLTEKPMAENKASAELMLEAAAKHSGVQLGVIFQNRYNPASLLMKRYVDEGRLGRLLCMKGIVTWHRSADYYRSEWKGRWATEGGGAVINQSIHTLDLLQWLGGEVQSIRGSITTDALEGVIEVEDTAHAHIAFKSGATAVFYATNAYGINSPIEMELVFEQGRLHLQGDYLHLHQGAESFVLSEPVENDLGEKSYWGISHAVQIRDFYKHLLKGLPFPLNGTEGYKALRLVMDLYESSRRGERVVYGEEGLTSAGG